MIWSGVDSRRRESLSSLASFAFLVFIKEPLTRGQSGRNNKGRRSQRVPAGFRVSQFNRKPSSWLMEVRRECARSLDENNDLKPPPHPLIPVPLPRVADPFRYKNRWEFQHHQADANYRLPQRKTFLPGTWAWVYLGRLNGEKGRVRRVKCHSALCHILFCHLHVFSISDGHLRPLSILLLRFSFLN